MCLPGPSAVSQRPYRAGLGLEAALAEIDKNRGTLYDPAVVGACTCLLLEQRLCFPDGQALSLVGFSPTNRLATRSKPMIYT